MLHKLIILLCIALMGTMSWADAQTAPVEVPAESQIVDDAANVALKKDLDQRYQELLQRFNQWKADATSFNEKYGDKNLDADTQEAKDGLAEQARITQALEDYKHDADQFKEDVSRLRLESPGARIIKGIKVLAGQLGMSPEKQFQIVQDFKHLPIKNKSYWDSDQIKQTWQKIMARDGDEELVKEASQGGGLGFPGAGQQSFQDCTIFALANAAGLPYGVVAARANLLISQGEWRDTDERANPQKVIEEHGLNGGEVIMLAEIFGQVKVMPAENFFKTLADGRKIMVDVVDSGGNVNYGHEVVLTKAFQHKGETWYVMMDSNQSPDQRRFLSEKELNIIIKENGVAFSPEKGTTMKQLK